MSFFSLLPVELCLVILTFVDFDSLVSIPCVEKYLASLIAKITTWQHLHKHRLSHVGILSTSIPEIKRNIWLSQHYYLTITNVEGKDLVVVSNNPDYIKGCLFAYRQFKTQKPSVIDYKIAYLLMQPGLVEMPSSDITNLLKPHTLITNPQDLFCRAFAQRIVDKITCSLYLWPSVRWHISPIYLLDATDDIKDGLLQTFQHLGLQDVIVTRIQDIMHL